MSEDALIDKIDAILPQTQCGLCTYAGCKPYATAIVKQNEALDKCLPGGVATLKALSEILNIDVSPLIDDLHQRSKPPSIAVIDEANCIGCTKCIQACPVDAIIGAPKRMHTIISDVCTGCDLCIAPCPVDCIRTEVIDEPHYDKTKARQRYLAKMARTQTLKQQRQAAKANAASRAGKANADSASSEHDDIMKKRAFIAAALERVANKHKREEPK